MGRRSSQGRRQWSDRWRPLAFAALSALATTAAETAWQEAAQAAERAYWGHYAAGVSARCAGGG